MINKDELKAFVLDVTREEINRKVDEKVKAALMRAAYGGNVTAKASVDSLNDADRLVSYTDRGGDEWKYRNGAWHWRNGMGDWSRPYTGPETEMHGPFVRKR